LKAVLAGVLTLGGLLLKSKSYFVCYAVINFPQAFSINKAGFLVSNQYHK
jgi:hypothetical protein